MIPGSPVIDRFGRGMFCTRPSSGTMGAVPAFRDMKTWTEHLGRSRLRSFTDGEGHLWLEQNAEKRSKWARLAREGHDVAWEFDRPGGSYTGRMLIDGEIYTPSEATKKLLQNGGSKTGRGE
jgi:hypothetical protein